MNGYERFMAALRGEEPDRIPVWELIVNRPVINALYGRVGYMEFIEKEDMDGVTAAEDVRVIERLSDTEYRDEWGIVRRAMPVGTAYIVGHPIKTEADLESYTPPDPDADYRLNALKTIVDRFKGKRAIVFLCHDAFEFSHYLHGLEDLLMDYLLNPDLATRLARIVIDYKKRVVERAIDEGADVILTGDDYAWKAGPMMSPALFREFVLPYLHEIVDVARSRGVPFIKHTDGNVWSILDMIVDAGIDALHPIEPMAGMDIGQVKEKHGDRIALVGNVDCTDLLPRGTEEDVVEAVKETIAKAGVGGGYILSSSNSIHHSVKPQNYRAMVRAARDHGQYPLDAQMVEEYGRESYIAKRRQAPQ